MKTFGTLLAFLSLLTGGPATAGEPESGFAPESRELGFAEQWSTASDGRAVLTLVDEREGTRLRVTYSLEGRIEQYEWTTAGGALLERYEAAPGRARVERFGADERRVIESRAGGQANGALLIEETVFEGGRASHRVYEKDAAEALSCRLETDPGLLETNLKAFLSKGNKFLAFNHAREDDGTEKLGPNVVAKGCQSYPARGKLSPEQSLAKDLERGMSTGIRCLATVSDYFGKKANSEVARRLRRDAALLVSLLRPPNSRLTINCASGLFDDKAFALDRLSRAVSGHGGDELAALGGQQPDQGGVMLARAVPCETGGKDAPAIAVNLLGGARALFAKKAPMVLLHEAVHLLGPGHYHTEKGLNDSFDSMNECCFPEGDNPFEKTVRGGKKSEKDLPPGMRGACKWLVTKAHGARL